MNPEPKNSIGQRLRLLRRQAGMSQEDLAGKAGINRSYLSMVENGKSSPTIELAEKLARGLGIDTRKLLTGENERHYEFDTGEEFDMHPGLREFLNSEEDMLLMNPTPEEIEMLRGAHFRHFEPTKQFYKDVLIAYRRSKR